MKRRRQGGFTLIELAFVMGISALVASGLIGMFNAHIQMLNQASQFKFLAQDAPLIELLLTKTIGSAEDFRLYASSSDAKSESNPVLDNAKAVGLRMCEPNNTFRRVVISFENINNQQGLYLFLTDSSSGTFTVPPVKLFSTSPVSLSAITFAFDSPTDPHPGVLLVTLKGSYNDYFTFAAEKK
jgi:prepilin-type N-terminal cleavage/methylation domain-containing protein